MSAPEPPAPPRPEPDPPLDRTISPISGRLGGGSRRRQVLTLAGLLLGGGVLAHATWSTERPQPARPPERPARQVVAYEPAAGPRGAPPGTPSTASPLVPEIQPDDADLRRPAPGVAETRPSRPRPAPLLAYARRAPDAGPDLGLSPEPVRAPQAAGVAVATAERLGDRNFLLLAGTSIPCTLQTALDSTTPGLATCVIGADVYSDNGAVVLLEKGSRVLGEYRGGLRQGQRRLFVVWTRAVTPGGVAIALASPAADALGRAGFEGAVDTRFWDRFGAAVLLSVVDAAGGRLVRRGRDADFAQLPSDASAIAAEAGRDIGPTLRKPQGAQVTILAAKDFDFSGVYGLRALAP